MKTTGVSRSSTEPNIFVVRAETETKMYRKKRRAVTQKREIQKKFLWSAT